MLAELSWPGPLSKGVREIELGKGRHCGSGLREGLNKLDEADLCQFYVDVGALYTAVQDQGTAFEFEYYSHAGIAHDGSGAIEWK